MTVTQPLLTDCDVENMQAYVATFWPDTCTITRPAADSNDGMGGQSAPSYTTVASNVACLDEPASYKEQESVKHITAQRVRSIKFTGGQDVRLKDRVVLGSRTCEVIDVQRRSTYEIVIPVLAVEVA